MSRKTPNRSNRTGTWKKAKATPAQQAEIDRIIAQKKKEQITGRQVEFLQLQKDYRELYLTRCLKGTSLTELKTKLDNHDAVFSCMDKAIQVSDDIEWIGVKYPVTVLKCKYNLELFHYGGVLSKENEVVSALINYGLTKEQIESIVTEGKYVKELPPQPEPEEEDIEEIERLRAAKKETKDGKETE